MRRTALVRSMLIAGALLAAFGAPAKASCKDDIAELKPLLAGKGNKPNIAKANKELLTAQQNVKSDEIACDDAVARAWRAYRTRPDQDQAAVPNNKNNQ